MLNEATDGRRKRALEIAPTPRFANEGNTWSVPSQSLNGRYTVTKAGDDLRCSCPDYEMRGQTCKHGFAVEFVIRREDQRGRRHSARSWKTLRPTCRRRSRSAVV